MPYKVDCFQNLLLTLLSVDNTDLSVFGSTWPWNFYREPGSNEITHEYFVSRESIRTFKGYELLESEISEDILTEAVHLNAIIVNVDQYHVKHHYPDIFQKIHGPHSLLLLKYDKSKAAFLTIGVFPQFKGWIDKDEIMMGINSCPKDIVGTMKYFWLEKIENWGAPTKEAIKHLFISSTIGKPFRDNLEALSLEEICFLFEELYHTNKENFVDYFSKISKDRWFWEIDRLGHILISYLSSENYSPIESIHDREEVISLVHEINQKILLSFRKMYKYQLTHNQVNFEDGITILKDAVQQSILVKQIIREDI